MRIKSFFAKTVDEAIAQARGELGEEALLLNTRKLAGEPGRPAGYEVVFGIVRDQAAPSPENANGVSTPPPAAPAQPAMAPPASPGELERLQAQIEEIRNLIARSSRHPIAPVRSVPELADIYARLLSAEVDAALCKEIVDRVEASMATDAFFGRIGTGPESRANASRALRADSGRLEELVRAEMTRRVGIDPWLGTGGGTGAVVALVGPSGAGKTTSLVKLAASPLASGRPVRILTVDSPLASPLPSLAKTFGIAVEPVPSIHLLPDMIKNARKSEIVLIDTPDHYTLNDRAGLEAAAGVFLKCPDLDVHLVVPGCLRASDLNRCIRRYEVFLPTKLLVTKLDQTRTLGPVFSEAARAGLRLSFLAHGPALPDDIRPASAEDLAGMVFDRQNARSQYVA